jgi:7-keto-8-aminopelargonate synthetase-like enzyme
MLAVMLTDKRITELLAMPKAVVNKGARETKDGPVFRIDYQVVARVDDEEFSVFVRRHTVMIDNFTAGLRWLPKSAEPVILMRCNGSSHRHSNQIEGTRFEVGHCHVHVATERYITAGKNAEHYAETTSTYSTAQGALHELCRRCNISGLDTTPDELDLFA